MKRKTQEKKRPCCKVSFFVCSLNMRYFIITFGCDMNRSDSERIESVLQKIGWRETDKYQSADLIIVNSCSVRERVTNRVKSWAQKIKNLKTKKWIGAIVTGCLLEKDRKEFARDFDYVLDIKDLSILEKRLKEMGKKSDIYNNDKISPTANLSDVARWQAGKTPDYFKIKPHYKSSYRAAVPIMTGCNKFCTYCAVPYARGNEISRKPEDILKEIKILIKNGYKEITLVGQNVNSYGNDFLGVKEAVRRRLGHWVLENKKVKLKKTPRNHVDFPKLLRLVNKIPGKFWIHFLSPHPQDFSDNLIRAMRECDKFSGFVSIPLQSGSDKILKMMNRTYTASQYLELIKKIRRALLDIALATDTIVGFPGETNKDFKETVKVYKKAEFDMAFIARYSPRPGTAAANVFKDNVAPAEKKRRHYVLNEVLKETALLNNKKCIGKNVEVLIDKVKKADGGWQIQGKTRTFKTVVWNSVQKKNPGDLTFIKIAEATSWGLRAAG